MRGAQLHPFVVPRGIDRAVAGELEGAVHEVGRGLGFGGPEDGAVAVQEDGGDVAGVEVLFCVGDLEGEAELRRHCEVDVPDDGEEGGGSQESCVDV